MTSSVDKLLYASGNFGKTLVWTSFDAVLLFYLTRIGHLSLPIAGSAIAVAYVADGACDLVIAYCVDRTGRADLLRWLLRIGAPLCGISFAAIFHLEAGAGASPLLLVLACALCRVGYSLCDVAHNALLVNLSAGRHDAAIVTGLRLMFSAAAAATVGLAFKSGLHAAAARDAATAFTIYAAIGGFVYAATLLAATRLADSRLHGCRRTASPLRLPAAIRSLWSNSEYRRLCALVGLQSGVTALFVKGLPFLGEALFADPAWAGDALVVITLAQSAVLPIFIVICRAGVSHIALLRASHLLAAASLVTMAWLGGSAAAVRFVPLAGIGVGLSGMNLAVWAMLATLVRRMVLSDAYGHALPIGMFLAALKVAGAIGSTVLAFGLFYGPALTSTGGMAILTIALAAPFVSSMICLVLSRPIASDRREA